MLKMPQKLSMADLDGATEVISRAFQDDPLWQYLLPDVEKRKRQQRKLYRVFMTAGIRNGQAYGVSDPLEGVAVWSKPDEKTGFSGLMGSGLLSLILSPVIFSFIKAAPIFGKFEAMQKQYAPEPHYYLNTIGVLPEAQGKGLASKLIRPFLDEAREKGASVYTETMTPGNVSLYEHYGFQVMEEYRVPNTDLCLWAFYLPPSR
jgi:ribosomal protein S18 acetylase RimI-like enzyme